MSDSVILWPVKIGKRFAVGYFKGQTFIRISKYYNTETIMRIERNRLASMPAEALAKITKFKEREYAQSAA